MKRKNPDFNKARRFIRKAKFSTEHLSSTSYIYLKLFFLWFLVVVSDFLIEFRFEYLWPFYLCIRNIYDIFKYQGFAFSAFFVFVTLTSNAICFFVMPVQWLYFTASTYVWLQYIWNSEKGICLQTFTVWLIFVYVEATVRLKELKNMQSHLDLCRPMAATCIGYPFVTLGFGVKRYLNYKIMLRRQKEVEEENELTFYSINKLYLNNNDNNHLNEEELNNNINDEEFNNNHLNDESDNEETTTYKRISSSNDKFFFKLLTTYLSLIINKFLNFYLTNLTSLTNCAADTTTLSSSLSSSASLLSCKIQQQHNNQNETNDHQFNNESIYLKENSIDLKENSIDLKENSSIELKENSIKLLKKAKQDNKSEIKKLKADLQILRQSESEYKDKLNKMQVNRNELKFQCSKLQSDNTALQSKLHNFLNAKQQDKNLINELEKKLLDERKAKSQLENKLNKYSKVIECGDVCKQRRQEFEDCLNKLSEEIRLKDQNIAKLRDENLADKALLLNALGRTNQLESNLREETKLKLELFSVLGETRRQLEMNQILLFQKSNEVEELNCKLTAIMAVLPAGNDIYSSIFLPNSFISNSGTSQQSSNVDQNQQHHDSSLLKNTINVSNNSNMSNFSNFSNKTSSTSTSAESSQQKSTSGNCCNENSKNINLNSSITPSP